MKNLEIMGVQEMDAKEMRNENGGSWVAAAVATAILAGVVWGIANFVKDVIIEGKQFDMTEW